jgi:hypothetical protein
MVEDKTICGQRPLNAGQAGPISKNKSMRPPYKPNLNHRPVSLLALLIPSSLALWKISFFLNRKYDGDTKVGLVLHSSVVEIKFYLRSTSIVCTHMHIVCASTPTSM